MKLAKNKNRDRDDDAPDVYFIPPNYVDSSGVCEAKFHNQHTWLQSGY